MAESTPSSRSRRNRQTRRSVIYVEHVARAAITAGGIGTILAVALIFVFLAWVVVPLFSSPELLGDHEFDVHADAERPFGMGVDHERELVWTLHRSGELELRALATGELIDTRHPFGELAPSAASFSNGRSAAVFGFPNGTVRIGEFGFDTQFLDEEGLPAEVLALAEGESMPHAGGIVERTTIGQLRLTSLELELDDPLPTGDDAAVVAIDHAVAPAGLSMLIYQEDGALRVSRVRSRRNLMTGETTKSLKSTELAPAAEVAPAERPVDVLVGGLGQHIYVVWRDGRTQHYDLRDFTQPKLYEEIDLVEDPAAEVTAVEFVAGRKTLLVGDSTGHLVSWFPAQIEGVEGSGSDPLLERVHTLVDGGPAVVAIAPSPRSRMVALSFADGGLGLHQATLGERLIDMRGADAALALVIPPKEDALIARSATGIRSWEIDTKYPEVSLRSLFEPVWYEGYAEPTHVWQSSSASDDFEPKFGLMPLVFGTLKATLYSMLFGAPLAILAAIYTSEFMAASLRSSVKATVELMASLPSVVLGFIAALVIAPFVQAVLPAVMAAFLTMPITTLLGAYLWQLLPGHLAVRWGGWQRFSAILLTVPLGVLAAIVLGPLVESLVFGGDISAWLSGIEGAAFGGWFFLMLPLAALLTVLVGTLIVNPRMRTRQRESSRSQVARSEAGKFVGGVLVAIAIAALIAVMLQGMGLDPRGGVLDTYVQRNALIVGFAMGFAIVPIIYTLAEDSLSEVPGALREGSLGAGATPWQTTVRIVLPFAMSGIFSAMMIGLGRAVGETMIVLMAAGNTPIMDWNIFNGFRTLSANIAVELPEAVVGSGHYRALFLAALVLFALTFVLNTLAELVRRHFRKRFSAL